MHSYYYLKFILSNRYQIQMKRSHEQLYSISQLQEIDRIIETNMESHLQSLIETKLTMLLQQEMNIVECPSTIQSPFSLEQNVCNIFNHFTEQWTKKEQKYVQIINEQTQEKHQMEAQMKKKDDNISQQCIQISEKDIKITELIKQKHFLNSIIFNQRQQLNSSNQGYLQHQSTKEELIQKQIIQIKQISSQLQLRQSQNQRLVEQKKMLEQQLLLLSRQLQNLENQLAEDIQRSNLNLITSNILVNEINDAHEQKLKQMEKYIKIHKQNMVIINLISQVRNLVKADLISIEAYEPFQLPIYFTTLDQINYDLAHMAPLIASFADNLNKFSQQAKTKSKVIKDLEIKLYNMEQQLIQYKRINKILSQIHNLTQKKQNQPNNQEEHVSSETDILKEKVKLWERQYLEKRMENKLLSDEVYKLNQTIKQLTEKYVQQIAKEYNQAETQTEQIKLQIVESRIKKQIIKPSTRRQVEKSHSLLSQRQQNKQNVENQNRNVISSSQKDGYKQKIKTLNQLINYMINYSKGFDKGQIRNGSWFMNQICKYGQEYEQRLMDASHIGPKIKNMRLIEGLCKQDNNCNKLIKQFESIIEFYICRSAKLSAQTEATPLVQQKLNKTVNKSKHPQNNALIF